jgi:23S rRNA maturation mini-RNase III
MAKHLQPVARPDLWTAIFSGILAVTAVGALWYARDQIRETHAEAETQIKEARQQAQIQHLIELVNEFDQEPMATYRRGLAEKRLKQDDDDPKELYRVLDFFETVGLLVNRGYLNEEDVWNEFGCWILNLNADSEMRANVEYENNRDPTEYANYLQLVARLQRIDAAHNGNSSRLTKEDVTAFYKEELTIVGGSPIRTHRSEAKQVKKSYGH